MDIVHRAIEHTNNAYVIRDAGSFVVGQTRDKTDDAGGSAIRAWLKTLDWTEVTDEVREDGMGFSACRYFTAAVPSDVEAYEAIAEWGLLTPEAQAAVTVRKSPHASGKTGHLNELISADISPTRAYRVVMAVGHGENPMFEPAENPKIYFWAPGRFTKFTVITDAMAEDKSLIPPRATVKLEGPLVVDRL